MPLIARAFAAGATLPALLMPFILWLFGLGGMVMLSQAPFFHFMPFIWGVWNVLYFHIPCPFKCKHRRMWAGALLGLLVAFLAVKVVGVFGMMVGFTPPCLLTVFLGVPIVYAALWHYFVGWMNQVVGLKEKK